jgi:hypothetical protein
VNEASSSVLFSFYVTDEKCQSSYISPTSFLVDFLPALSSFFDVFQHLAEASFSWLSHMLPTSKI